MPGHLVLRSASSTTHASHKRRLRLWLTVLGLSVLTLSGAADAAPATCGRRVDVLAQLAKQFDEFPAAIGSTAAAASSRSWPPTMVQPGASSSARREE